MGSAHPPFCTHSGVLFPLAPGSGGRCRPLGEKETAFRLLLADLRPAHCLVVGDGQAAFSTRKTSLWGRGVLVGMTGMPSLINDK